MTAAYPPQPWHLAGEARVSLWRIPAARLPRIPPGVTPARVAGRAVAGTAWIDYQPSGQLAYRELLAAVMVHNGPRLSVCITEIWVDSEVSRAGGRALWAIPKDLATMEFGPDRTFTAVGSESGDWIATAGFTMGPRSPLRLPSAFRVSQAAPEGVRHSPVTATGRPATARAAWRFNPDGPLGYLAGHRPVLSLALSGFDMRFGARP
ncbi:acetoacetate decarboxylase [Amycolatopsis antarctica]|uniref:Acetoacetate decarboxylase n=1 Tax=Amycolatopsis antarctica TaxID=1854586 RepID=A0A263D1V8_9PSEU|nr:acetoacetate decarboxylase family protein [Amycolatopsis antarctica]OZM72331.1 acetoacetate decarboxylase [Amycolatopsis antarctica]